MTRCKCATALNDVLWKRQKNAHADLMYGARHFLCLKLERVLRQN